MYGRACQGLVAMAAFRLGHASEYLGSGYHVIAADVWMLMEVLCSRNGFRCRTGPFI